MNITSEKASIKISDYTVSSEIYIPDGFKKALIIANGAGADMKNAFISKYCLNIAQAGFLTMKFNFHYQEIGRKIPDKNEKCQQTYLGVIDFLKENYIREKNIAIGGKSMGGRIATQIAARLDCQKIVVFGYPLHPPGKPDKIRDGHLYPLRQQLLIIQGENDAFGSKAEMDPVISKIAHAGIWYVPQGNHSLKAPKKSGLDNNELEKQILVEVIRFLKN